MLGRGGRRREPRNQPVQAEATHSPLLHVCPPYETFQISHCCFHNAAPVRQSPLLSRFALYLVLLWPGLGTTLADIRWQSLRMTVACAFMDSSWSARPLDPGPVGDKDSVATTSVPPSTALSNSASPFSAMNELAELAAASRRVLYETRPSVADDAPAPHTMSPSRHNAGHQHVTGSRTHDARPQHTPIEDGYAPQPSAPRHHTLSRSNSQGTISSADNADLVFTPPTYGVRYSPNSGSAHSSNQENQLLRLSQIAAAQERIPEDKVDRDIGNGLLSRKRMADGMAKHTRELSNASPKEILGHSRNPSAVSVASTTGSRIGEVLPLFPSFPTLSQGD